MLPIKWAPKRTIWIIFWYQFSCIISLKLQSWRQQVIGSSQSDFSFHPLQLLCLLARLLTGLSVGFSSKRSDPGSGLSSGGDRLHTPPSPLGRAPQKAESNRSKRPSGHQSQLCNTSKQRRSHWRRPSLIVIHLAVHRIFCPEQHNPLVWLPGPI